MHEVNTKHEVNTNVVEVLHLEDNPEDADLIGATLRKSGFICDITLVKSLDDFTRSLGNKQFDLILSDYSRSSFNGKDAFEIARKLVPGIPFIFVSGTLEENAAIQSIVDGATDYVLKSRLARLAPAVKRAMSETAERTRRARAEELREIALEELRKSEARFRGVLECAPDAAVIVDRDWRITFANAQAERTFGYAMDELVGKNLDELVPERFRGDHRGHVRNFSRRPRARALGRGLELYGRRADGTEFPADIMLSPLTVEGDMAVLAMVRDVTAAKMAEKALRESEARFRQIYESSPVGIVNVDPEGKVVRCNPAVPRLLGYSEEELRQMKYNDFTHPEDRTLGLQMTAELMSGKREDVKYEKRYVRKDGREVWVHVTHSAIRDEKGAYRLGLGIIEDFTERKNAVEALKMSEDRYRNLVESARDAIFSLSTNAIIESLNRAFETFTGWSRDEWIGKSVTDLLHPADRGRVLERFRDVLMSKVPEVARFRVLKKDGTYAVGEFSTTSLMQEGRAVGILSIARDVTSQVMLEEELRQSQKMESIGTLAGGIAHDFNNILGIIIGYSTLSRKSLDPENRLSKNLAAIESAAQRGIGLVRQLLMFARKQERVQQLLDVNGIVSDIYRMVRETFPRVISTEMSLGEGKLNVYGDPTEIHQIVLNLCVNARDAMIDQVDRRLAGGKLTMVTSLVPVESFKESHPSARFTKYVRIEVSDTGKGMDEKTRERIFEPFYTTKERGKGTGLGLATVYGIVNTQEGFVDVASRVGEGTTFTVLLPCLKDSTALETEAGDQVTESPGGTETILIVEDELALRDLLYSVLADKGYNVITAKDGQGAFSEFVEHREVQLIISDLGLPKVGGLDLFIAARKMKPGLKTILVSGFVNESDRERMLQSGVNGFLQKPYGPREVLRKVREVLDSSSGQP